MNRPWLLAIGLFLAIVLPPAMSNYFVNIATLVFFAAFLGQSWNLSGGYAAAICDRKR